MAGGAGDRCTGILVGAYEDFYASVSRDGATIHLQCAEKLDAERAHRRTRVTKPLENRPWGQRDFRVEDPDGYILGFSEPT